MKNEIERLAETATQFYQSLRIDDILPPLDAYNKRLFIERLEKYESCLKNKKITNLEQVSELAEEELNKLQPSATKKELMDYGVSMFTAALQSGNLPVWVKANQKPKELLRSYYCKVWSDAFNKEFKKQVLITADGNWQDNVTEWLDENSPALSDKQIEYQLFDGGKWNTISKDRYDRCFDGYRRIKPVGSEAEISDKQIEELAEKEYNDKNNWFDLYRIQGFIKGFKANPKHVSDKQISDEEIEALADGYVKLHGLGFGNKTSFVAGFKANPNHLLGNGGWVKKDEV